MIHPFRATCAGIYVEELKRESSLSHIVLVLSSSIVVVLVIVL